MVPLCKVVLKQYVKWGNPVDMKMAPLWSCFGSIFFSFSAIHTLIGTKTLRSAFNFGIAGPWTFIMDPDMLHSGPRFRSKNTQNLLLFISLNCSKFWGFWTEIFGNLIPESSISGSKVQAQGPAIPKCLYVLSVPRIFMSSFRAHWPPTHWPSLSSLNTQKEMDALVFTLI